jgi:hypothetical protein
MSEIPERIRTEKGYESVIMETLITIIHEASQQGLLAEFEDDVDTLWAFIPTDKKVTTRVWKHDLSADESAILEYQSASKILPPDNLPESGKKMHKANKERALRKLSISIDTLNKMGVLYKEPRVGRMMEDGDTD